MIRKVLGLTAVLLVMWACPKPKPPQPPDPCQRVQCPADYKCVVDPATQTAVCESEIPTGCPEGQCLKGYTNAVPPRPICGECTPEEPPPLGPFCEKGRLAAGFHTYLQGLDVSWQCRGDHEFCDSWGMGWWGDGRPRYDCALGPDETELRFKREESLGCPAAFWRRDGSKEWRRCTSQPVDGGVSCTHWDLHNVPPFGCAPETGFFVIPHGGKGEDGVKKFLRFCSLKKPEVCSEEQEVDF